MTELRKQRMYDSYGNPIRATDEAVNMHDSCVHHAVYNQFLHYDTATTTTLNVAATAEANQLDFVSVTGFAVGDEIKIENGSLEPLFPTIRAIAGTLVDIDTPITFDHPIGADITKVHTNMAEAGLTTSATRAAPVIFTSHVPTIAIVHITNMSVIMTDANAMDFTTFGGIAALTNGCVLRAQSDGAIGGYTNWKRNDDMDSDAFPVSYQEKVGGGEHGLKATYHIKESTEGIVYLDGAQGDNFQLLAQDPLDGNTTFRIKLQGHYEGL